jgi:hypothetical protein
MDLPPYLSPLRLCHFVSFYVDIADRHSMCRTFPVQASFSMFCRAAHFKRTAFYVYHGIVQFHLVSYADQGY